MPEDLNPAVGAQPEQPPTPSEPTAPSADASGTAPDSETGEEGEQPQRPKGDGFQRRINRLTSDKYRAEARAEMLEARLRELEQRSTGTQAPASRQPAEDDPAPSESEYDRYEDYIDAKARWSARNEFKQLSAKTTAQQREQIERFQAEQLQHGYRVRALEFAKATPDFAEVVHGAEEVPLSRQLELAIMESEMGPQLVYHLAKNPAEAERLVKLPQGAMYREIGKLEAKLSSAPKPQPAVSKAPAPIAPLSGGKASAAPFDPFRAKPDDPRWDEWRRERNKKTA